MYPTIPLWSQGNVIYFTAEFRGQPLVTHYITHCTNPYTTPYITPYVTRITTPYTTLTQYTTL